MLAFAAPGNAVITSKESEAQEKEVTSWSGYRLVSNKGTLLFSPPVPEWFMSFFTTFNALHGMTSFCFNLPTPPGASGHVLFCLPPFTSARCGHSCLRSHSSHENIISFRPRHILSILQGPVFLPPSGSPCSLLRP